MTENNFINFRKERDLGEVLSDTFKFLRENYKPLFQVFLRTAFPALLIAALGITVYNFLVLGGKGGLFSTDIYVNSTEFSGNYILFFISGFFFFMLSIFLFLGIFQAGINYSVQSYMHNEGEIDVEETLIKVRANWARYFGMALLTSILTFIGLLFCFIPGIYMGVPLSMVYAAMTFYGLGVGPSITESFKLIKGNWWISFFTIFLIIVIWQIASTVLQLPATIYSLMKTFTSSSSIQDFANMFSVENWPYLLLQFLGTVLQYALFVMVILCQIFIFFNLDEKKNQTGAMERIEKLGEKE